MDVSPRQNPAYRLSRLDPAMKQRLWILVLMLYAAGIAALSHLSFGGGEGWTPFVGFDKLFHAAEFALFYALAWRSTGRRRLLSLLLTAVYAASDELHQAFVPGRDASAFDFLADIGGAGAACLFLSLIRRLDRPLWRLRRRRILRRANEKGDT